MNEAGRHSQRLAAAAFLVVCLPALVAIAIAGGLAALGPLLLLLALILKAGRPPGLAALERVRSRVASARRPASRHGLPRPRIFVPSFLRSGLLLANSLAERGPPRALPIR